MKHPLAPVGGLLVVAGIIALTVFAFPLVVALALILSLFRGMSD